MATFSPVSHVIFDLDGTILDSETIYTETYRTVIKSYGKTYDNKLRLEVTGTLEKDTARIMVERLNLKVPVEDFVEQVKTLQVAALPNVTLKAGAERLIRHLHAHNVPLAIATSSSKEKCQIKLVNYQDLMMCFNHMVNGSSDDEVVNGKPAPDIFLVTAKRFIPPADPSKCLVFEDALNGVLAAKAAGMQVVMVPEDYVPTEMTKPATLAIKSLEDFKPEDFGLPPYPK